jgi:carboxyl-terminal processing protease
MGFDQREDAKQWVHTVADKLREWYYDPDYHGVDLKAREKQAEDKVKEVPTLSDVYGVIAWMLEPLNDSHTFFLPPARPYDVQNGWELGFIGEKCYITAVQPGSDAEAQGVHPGDEVLSLEGFTVTRSNLWKLRYSFDALAPRLGMHMLIRPPEGPTRELLVNAKVTKLPKVVYPFTFGSKKIASEQDPRAVEVADSLMIWKLPRFNIDDGTMDKFIRQAQKRSALILDLRGNPGGSELVVSRLISAVFSREVRVGEKVKRKSKEAWAVKPLAADKHFTGKLLILVDADSGSAAEVFARVVQLEQRGKVLGDRSSGSVMEARHEFFRADRFGTPALGLSVTQADLLMTDGQSLEHAGVIPDELVLPSPQDLAQGRDPVLARAVADVNIVITPEQAGKLFPVIWRNI